MGVLADKPGAGDGIAERRYNKLARFYVVANRYEQDTCIGMHSDFNVCYVVLPPAPSGPQLQRCGRWGLVD